jgi:O-acetyl-ADP-ribose deacetylase
VRGNIVNQPDVEAVVNAANASLAPGGGVAGIVHRAAGAELYQECMLLAPIMPGEAVITEGYHLPNPYVIHCLGPVYGVDKPEDELLSSCYTEALKLAEKNKITSIAFCAISTGAFAYPVEAAADVALKAVVDYLPKLSSLKLIRFVLYSENDQKIHARVLTDITL